MQHLASASADTVELGPRIEDQLVGGGPAPGRRGPTVAEVGQCQRGDQLHVAQPTGAVLEVGFTAVRDDPGAEASSGDRGHEIVEAGGDLVPPLATRAVDDQRAQIGIAGDHPGVQQAESDQHVSGGHRQTLLDGADAVVKADPRVPQRIPERVGEGPQVAPGASFVHQHQIEVGMREDLPPAETSEGDQGEPGIRPHPRVFGQPSQFPLVQLTEGRAQLGGRHVLPASGEQSLTSGTQ